MEKFEPEKEFSMETSLMMLDDAEPPMFRRAICWSHLNMKARSKLIVLDSRRRIICTSCLHSIPTVSDTSTEILSLRVVSLSPPPPLWKSNHIAGNGVLQYRCQVNNRPGGTCLIQAWVDANLIQTRYKTNTKHLRIESCRDPIKSFKDPSKRRFWIVDNHGSRVSFQVLRT